MISTTQRKISQSHGLVTAFLFRFYSLSNDNQLLGGHIIAHDQCLRIVVFFFSLFISSIINGVGAVSQRKAQKSGTTIIPERMNGNTDLLGCMHLLDRTDGFCSTPALYPSVHIPPPVLETHHLLVVDYLCLPIGSLLSIS